MYTRHPHAVVHKRRIFSYIEQQLGQVIGRGGFAAVHKAINLITGEVVAVKRFDASQVSKSAMETIKVAYSQRFLLTLPTGGGRSH